jgi:hypothetical protein
MADQPRPGSDMDVPLGDQDGLVLVATASTGRLVVMKLEARLIEYGEVPLRIHLVGLIKSLVVVEPQADATTEEPPSTFN